MAHNSYTYAFMVCLIRMYTLSFQACSPRTLGVHIRQTTHAHVMNTDCSHINYHIIV